MSLEADVILDGHAVQARFDVQAGELTWCLPSSPENQSALNRRGSLSFPYELLGFRSGASTIHLRFFPKVSVGVCCSGSDLRRRGALLLDFHDSGTHGEWLDAFNSWIGASGRPQKLLVIVNPIAGKGKAKAAYKGEVQPLLEAANVEVTLRETADHREALEIARDMPLGVYDGVACVSGDGILNEVVNGWLQRPDWRAAIRTPLGHIPSGSGNGIAKSALTHREGNSGDDEDCSVANATFVIIAGRRSPLDVISVVQGSRSAHGILNFYWGMVGDVDVESEKYRWMGGLRLTFQTLVRAVCLRRYRGSIQYVPADSRGRGRGSLTEGWLEGGTELAPAEGGGFRPLSPSDVEPNEEWRTLDGVFVSLWCQNLSWAAIDLCPAPHAKLCDGCLHMLVLRDCSPLQVLYIFLNMALGHVVETPTLQCVKVRALKLQAGGRTNGNIQGGIVAMDGEVLARGAGSCGTSSSDPMNYDEEFAVTMNQGLATLYVA